MYSRAHNYGFNYVNAPSFAHAPSPNEVLIKAHLRVQEIMATKPDFYRIELGTVEWEIRETYQELSPLGIGAFGTVW